MLRSVGAEQTVGASAGELTRELEHTDIEQIADLAEAAGAGDAALTATRHDCYTLWLAAQQNPAFYTSDSR